MSEVEHNTILVNVNRNEILKEIADSLNRIANALERDNDYFEKS